MKKTSLPSWLGAFMVLLLFLVSCSRSPISTTIIYHKSDGLWRITPEGSDKTRITSSGWFGEYSPDNSKIAFSEFYDNGIWVVNTDGTDLTQLTSFGSGPSWSPNGSKLVFHAGGQSGANRYLWIMNADGTDVHQLSDVNGSHAHWSPDGNKIIFHGEVNNGIWLIDPDGNNETRFYADGGYPAWSPNGEAIVYVNLHDWCIWVMHADGTDKRRLTDHNGILPTWSAEGSQIAYEGGGKKNEGIWIINIDGSGEHRIIEEGKHPDWSN